MGVATLLRNHSKNNCHFRRDVLHSTNIRSRVRAVSRAVSLSTKLFEILPRIIIVSRIAFHNSFYPLDVDVNDANLKYTLERTTHPLLFYTLQQFPTSIFSFLSLSLIIYPILPFIQYQVEQHTKRIKTKLNREELFEFYPRIIYIHPMTRIFPFFSLLFFPSPFLSVQCPK